MLVDLPFSLFARNNVDNIKTSYSRVLSFFFFEQEHFSMSMSSFPKRTEKVTLQANHEASGRMYVCQTCAARLASASSVNPTPSVYEVGETPVV